MKSEQILNARKLLGLNQTELAKQLGWTSNRNIVNLERGDKKVMLQTELAIKFLLYDAGKLKEYDENIFN